jgi:drug/metabolite transporter (DMT)-like permease
VTDVRDARPADPGSPTPAEMAAPAAPRSSLSAPLATAFVVASALCFGSIAVLVSLATRTGAPLVLVLATRYAQATVLLLGIARADARLPARRWLTIALLGGAGQALIAILSLSALRYITAGTLSFLFYTYPAWVTLFAVLRGREHVDAIRLLALGSALAGVAVMVGMPGSEGMRLEGVLLALGSAMLYALYIPLVNHLQRGVEPAAAAGYIALGCATIFALAAFAMGIRPGQMTVEAWRYTVMLAVLSTAIAFILFLKGLAVLGPVRTSIISTIEPFFTALLGALLLGQPLSGRTLAGGALVAFAVFLLNRPQSVTFRPADENRLSSE